MIKLFKKQKSTNVSVVEQNQYPEIVQQIHKDFYTASDKLLQEANDIIKLAEEKNINKIERLKSLGINNCKEVVDSEEIINKSKRVEITSKLIKDYAYRYPMNKFITEEQVIAICNKYNLVMGDISRFKGFVPEKNLKEIENFKLHKVDENILITSIPGLVFQDAEIKKRSDYFHIYKKGTDAFSFQSDDGVNFYGGLRKNPFNLHEFNFNSSDLIEDRELFVRHFAIENASFKICAPLKDMDTRGLELKNGYKLTEIYIPDPVVLKPVKGGYLIVTAWGDEASDPIVVNQINN